MAQIFPSIGRHRSGTAMEAAHGASWYRDTLLDNLQIEGTSKRRKQVQEALKKRVAKLPRERLAKAIYRSLPEKLRDERIAVNAVCKVILLFEKSDFRQIIDERLFREKIRFFLRHESGRRWINEWLQPARTESGVEATFPAPPSQRWSQPLVNQDVGTGDAVAARDAATEVPHVPNIPPERPVGPENVLSHSRAMPNFVPLVENTGAVHVPPIPNYLDHGPESKQLAMDIDVFVSIASVFWFLGVSYWVK